MWLLRNMNKDEILNMAEDPQYIEGIYNYCDRWCERCPLTARCSNYALTEKNWGKLSFQDLQNKAFWEKLKEMFQLTIEMFTEWAKEQGIDSNQHLDGQAAAAEQSRREKAESHELARAARKYSDLVDQWFEQEQALFDERQEALNTIIELGVGGDEPFEEAAHINDAVEVIRWYQHQIYIKCLRALTNHAELEPDAEQSALRQDAAGSVKVALIGMDRSIGAWGELYKSFPAGKDNILDVLLHLDRLRRKAEALFPQARSFLRPGFDTLAAL